MPLCCTAYGWLLMHSPIELPSTQIGPMFANTDPLKVLIFMNETQDKDTRNRPPFYSWTDEQRQASGDQKAHNGSHQEPTGKSQPDYSAMAEGLRVRPDEEMSAPPVCLSIQQGEQSFTFGTMGNYSVLIGKTKARKTFTTTAAVAAAVKLDVVINKIGGHFDENKRGVLVFDTEQSRYHVLRVVKRICRLAGVSIPNNLYVYSLRALPTEQRLGFIEWTLYNTPNVGLAVIDGIRDLVRDINDNAEATERTGDLLRWTEQLNIHILTVIHMNKGNDQIRGSIGTELQNKAETVVSVSLDTNDKNISIVKAEYCRDREFEPFAFSIDDHGLPYLVEDWSTDERPARSRAAKEKEEQAQKIPRSITPSQLHRETHESILRKAFEGHQPDKYKVTYLRIKTAAEYLGYAFGENRAKEFLQYYKDHGLVCQLDSTYILNLAPIEEQVTNSEESSLV